MWQHSKTTAASGTAVTSAGGAMLPPDVLAIYGLTQHVVSVTAIPGGFSGANVWKVETKLGVYAVKRWPVGQPANTSLVEIHQLIQQAAPLSFIPKIVRTSQGQTSLTLFSSSWDVVTWMPGSPTEQPGTAQLQSAIRALAHLHTVWRTTAPPATGPCPAVERQHRRLSEWTPVEINRLRHDRHDRLLQEAVHEFTSRREAAIERLAPWLNVNVPLQPCLADVWSAHVLFIGSAVAGLIDFGGVRVDHPAQDLARLLSSYSVPLPDALATAFDSYPLLKSQFETLVRLLSETGSIVGLGNWLRWLILEHRHFADRQSAYQRLQYQLNRLCQPTGHQ